MRSSCGPYPRATFRQPQPPEIPHRYPPRQPNYRPDGCCRRPPPRPPSFIVVLLSDQRNRRTADIDAVIAKCKFKPENVEFSPSNVIVVSLFYTQWVHALEAIVCLWESRLDRVHNLTPKLNRFVSVPSDLEELQDRLRGLFTERIKKLIDGEAVKKWEEKRAQLSKEFDRVSKLLLRPSPVWTLDDLAQKKRRSKCEMELVESKIREFKSAMNCLLAYLDGNELEGCGEEGVQVFKFSREVYDWGRIQSIMARECHRLEEGLPIYAYRQQILQQILTQQVLVLIGETGSGKSTQLVQFLADSGIAAEQSIVCTQPRKIAATSLAERVTQESSGCYREKSIKFNPTFLSGQELNSKVIFMTDHCLLQHYMNDMNMSGISCIIIDEAHERSLNTDLLLALIKGLLGRRPSLRLVIMSATADAEVLSNYYYGCGIFSVVGRSFPVDVRYKPSFSEGTSSDATSYVSDVLRVATEVHKKEKEGTILAFLTSQMEVEWACQKFIAPGAIALPLHGKQTFEDQYNVFQSYPGRRKIIFATNLAETSLTIPGVKYVIDSGMAKESKFEPASGMNVLRVCRISRSSANQRSGRAGRTEPGICYRLYSKNDFEAMPPCQEPEIRRVHLGVAVLKILALGIKNLKDFEFIDAPCSEAIDMAMRNLIQLGAVKQTDDVFELTKDGRFLVKLGVEPRLGKLILGCYNHSLRREGLVLAAVMANSSSIFCRVGNDEEKLRSDCLKVQFCHRDGDLFTLLSVYKTWDNLAQEKKNTWCWENSINAKTMRRCQEMVKDLESCLKHELNMIIPSTWCWNPHESNDCDKYLKKVILSSLVENVAMFSGHDQLGYEVALSGQHVRLHPSCSLLVFGEKPSWVVFGELLSISNQYLVCVTSIDFNTLSTLCPPPLFDVSKMESQKLQLKVLTGFGSTLLKRFCGKGNCYLLHLVSRVRSICKDERINIKVDYYQNEITLFATLHDRDRVSSFVYDALECERKWMRNECLEKCLYHGSGVLPSIALFGAGAEIKHLELQKRCLTVDVVHSKLDSMDDKELLSELEKYASGSICAIHKFTGTGQESVDKGKSARITFLSPDVAQKAVELNESEFSGSILKVIPSQVGGDRKMLSFPAVRAKVYWPRRLSRGIAIVKCDVDDVAYMVNDFFNLLVGGRIVRCETSKRYKDSVVISGLEKDLSEAEILDVLRTATSRRILDFFLLRGDAVENPPCGACEDALLKEISTFMPKRYSHNSCSIQVFEPEQKNAFMRALITFDGRLHLEAAKALEQLEGKVLPGFLSWQKMKCQQLFHSSLSCPAPVYPVIKKQLDSLLSSFVQLNGVEWSLDRNANGSYRVKISANATKTVADLRRRVEELVKGKTIDHASLTPTILQLLFSRDGIALMHSLQRETGTYILFDRRNVSVQVFGSSDQVGVVQQKLVDSLLTLHENKLIEIRLQGSALPPELMKEVINRFGADLHGLKEKVPGADFSLNVRRQVISIHGNKDLKQKVEDNIYEIAQMTGSSTERFNSEAGRKVPLQCSAGNGGNDTFVVVPDVRFPNNSKTLAAENINECKSACLRNCSCTAFAYDNECLVWTGGLFNVKQLTLDEKVGKVLHLRIAASEAIEVKKESKTLWIVIGVLGGLLAVLLIIAVIAKNECSGEGFEVVEGSLVMFRYRVLRSATKNFSLKLGEGGFGSVFKGTLQNSTPIAVKRLNCPKQADKQFLTEVRTIGKVQHINLVRLRGFCAETSKRFLVYDYMPNGSLESVLFQKSPIVLDWKARYNIAAGTARGLAYLHEECRECIIHCDIKPENILLDAEYAPKIADFGLAKLMSRDFSRIITTMQGTRGYIAPEWISGEAITPKADAFSYGMLLFELISGRRNRDLLGDGLQNYFPTRVANVVTKEEDVITLLDCRLEGNADKEELMRACKAACWCIQDDEKDRPSMGQVVQLLEGVIELGIPPIPQFLDRFSKSLDEAIDYHDYISSASDSRHGYSSNITISRA